MLLRKFSKRPLTSLEARSTRRPKPRYHVGGIAACGADPNVEGLVWAVGE